MVSQQFEVIMRLVVIIIIVAILALLALNNIIKESSSAISEVISFTPSVSIRTDPCNYYCYAVQEKSENELMFSDFTNTSNTYTSVIKLPLYFSCNYQILDIATHAIELSRWVMDKPSIYIENILCADGLYVKKRGILGTSVNFCTGIILPAMDVISDSLDCLLYYDDKTLKLVCPGECRYNEFSANFTANDKITCDNSIDFSQLPPNAVNNKGNEYFNYPCYIEGDYTRNSNYCYLKSDSDKACSLEANNVDSYVCDSYYDIGLFKEVDINCKTSTIKYSGIDGDSATCKNRECTYDSDDKTSSCTNGDCSYAISKGVVSCDKPRTCVVLFDPNYFMVSSSDGKPYLYNNAGVKCTVLYNKDTCAYFCDDELQNNVAELKSYDLSDYYIHEDSGDLFDNVIGFTLERVYVLQESYENRLFDNVYAIIAKSEDEILMPRNEKVLPQTGLRNFKFDIEGVAETMSRGFKAMLGGDTSGVKAENVLTYFRGEVTYPYYFENATKFLFDCMQGNCDDKKMHSYYYYCIKDLFLSDYGYINCLQTMTLKDKLNPERFTFNPRKINDLKRGFYCDQGPYDACNTEMGKYGDDCYPAWATYVNHYGRCEDFAIMDYTIFKTLGIPEYSEADPNELSISLRMGYCTMPCACVRLAEKCGLEFEELDCAAPQYITLHHPSSAFGTFNACLTIIKGYPNWTSSEVPMNGSVFGLLINGIEYRVIQNFSEGYIKHYPVFFNKKFSSSSSFFNAPSGINLGNDLSFFETPEGIGLESDMCSSYTVELIDELIDECINYLEDSNDFRKNFDEIRRYCSQ